MLNKPLLSVNTHLFTADIFLSDPDQNSLSMSRASWPEFIIHVPGHAG